MKKDQIVSGCNNLNDIFHIFNSKKMTKTRWKELWEWALRNSSSNITCQVPLLLTYLPPADISKEY